MFAGFMDGLSYTPLTCCEVIEVLAGPLGASLVLHGGDWVSFSRLAKQAKMGQLWIDREP